MTYQPPCSDPDRNADDWFLGRDGKQYPDDEFLTEAERRGVAASVLRLEGDTDVDHEDRVALALRHAEGYRRRRALTARRHAREACHECYFRTSCLDRAIEEEHAHGTWGGYYEEELREIRREIARRKRARST